MKTIILAIIILTFTVITVKAQDPNDPNAGRTAPGNINLKISQDPYFKEYLRINKKNKEEKRLAKFYNRKLIVVLAEEDPVKLKYYKNSPDRLAFYKELIARNNELLTNLVPKYWKQLYSREKKTDTILYKKYSEVLELSKTTPEEYFTLEFSSLREGNNENLFALTNKKVDFRAELLTKEGEYGRMEIKLLEEFKKPPLHQLYTITSYPNELDFIVTIQQLSNFFLERTKFLNREDTFEEEARIKRESLKNKIILVDSFQVEKRNNKFTYVEEKFPATHAFTDAKGLLQIISSNDTSYAYAVVVPYFPVFGDNSFEYTTGEKQEGEAALSYFHLLISSENSEVLSYIRNESRIINKKSWARYANSFELDN